MGVQFNQNKLTYLYYDLYISKIRTRETAPCSTAFFFSQFLLPTLQLNWSVHKCIHKSFTKTLVSCSQLSNLLVFSSCHVIYVVQTSCTFNRKGFGRDTILKQVKFHQLLQTSHNDLPANYSSLKLASFQKSYETNVTFTLQKYYVLELLISQYNSA